MNKKEIMKKEREFVSKTNIKALQHFNITERMLKALILRKEGLTFEEIGARMGISQQGARRLFVSGKTKIHWLKKLINE
ncbi:MAG: hypothetical protein J6V44_16300 [Methanobrevibacter sp.]|nr:hypothetical protein [Methanobrevibacter sp.]MBO7692038.1 hypothetical protein [Methanobrevibacter sp.]